MMNILLSCKRMFAKAESLAYEDNTFVTTISEERNWPPYRKLRHLRRKVRQLHLRVVSACVGSDEDDGYQIGRKTHLGCGALTSSVRLEGSATFSHCTSIELDMTTTWQTSSYQTSAGSEQRAM